MPVAKRLRRNETRKKKPISVELMGFMI